MQLSSYKKIDSHYVVSWLAGWSTSASTSMPRLDATVGSINHVMAGSSLTCIHVAELEGQCNVICWTQVHSIFYVEFTINTCSARGEMAPSAVPLRITLKVDLHNRLRLSAWREVPFTTLCCELGVAFLAVATPIQSSHWFWIGSASAYCLLRHFVQ